ncbi:hypothetical protein ACROYT_G024636 [Oculina patagonica]
MKSKAIICLVAFLLLATLVTESNCISEGGPFQSGLKRELKGKQLKRVASDMCRVARSLGCEGMEQSAYDDRGEQQE